jgi:ATP/ADP translocase
VAFLWSLLVAYLFAVFFNALMERAEPPRLLTTFAMIAIPLFVGTGAADAVARDRDRDTLRLHVLTGMSARTYLSRRPTNSPR